MTTSCRLCGGIFVLTAAAFAQAVPVDLYANPDTRVGLQGPSGIGRARNQLFSPTQSTPLPLGTSAVLSGPGQTFFDSVSMHFQVNAPGETATVALRLFAVSGNIAGTLTAITNNTAIPIAQTGNISLSGSTDQWITLNLPVPQPATGQYIASTKLIAYTGTVGLESMGTKWAGTRTADGRNDAYTDTAFNNNRLYSIRLGALPEPAAGLLALGGGLILMGRRRRVVSRAHE